VYRLWHRDGSTVGIVVFRSFSLSSVGSQGPEPRLSESIIVDICRRGRYSSIRVQCVVADLQCQRFELFVCSLPDFF